MWNPSTLIPIYKTFDNQINRYFLENNVMSRAPKLVNVMDNYVLEEERS